MSIYTKEEKKYLMERAYEAALIWSQDPSYKVGALYIDSSYGTDFHEGFQGANRAPEQWDHSKESFPWSTREPFEESKYAFVIHAEVNAITSSWQNFDMDSIFITGYPCIECAKLIVASGIKYVFYAEEPKGPTAHLANPVAKLFWLCGVKLEKVEVEQ